MSENKSSFQKKKADAKEMAEIFSKLTEEQKNTMFIMAMGYELLNNKTSKHPA
ncbi:hypothetical protein N4T77_02870 [Clostridium sp. CX1]|uniref:hypothetical protein n=1 Tax=Clostridium sp. CX1 TaxID=2978346 RepID=UPI0021BDFF52|nr:hypothetical protein [Clostridium sp. CX1]MCT8975534.1 hypothetical protein [Clostridium sp. CX1]